MKQTTLTEARVVEWRCIAGHANWRDNTFTFTLRSVAGETSLRFVQEYAQELDDDTYGTYNFNWGYYLNSLKRLYSFGGNCSGGNARDRPRYLLEPHHGRGAHSAPRRCCRTGRGALPGISRGGTPWLV